MSKFKTTIGLEIHVQLATKSKMFCSCDNQSFAEVKNGKQAKIVESNKNTCPVCLGMPGVLPVANKTAILWTIKTGLALNCGVAEISKFDRKHYFYPDLPKGFQISQYDRPIARRGELKLKVSAKGRSASGGNSEKLKAIRINRVHLEEDAGKLVHKNGASFVDLNRAGTPLMEVVTEPDITSPKMAKIFLKELQLIVQYLEVSKASMEKGHLRCDANIDVKDEKGKMSPIVELKNINSFRFIERALNIEEKRLQDEYDSWPSKKSKITRGYDSKKDQTYLLRQKEEAADYRYFPEPDIPPIEVKNDEIDINKLKAETGDLPDDLREKLKKTGISEAVVEKIVTNFNHANYLMDARNLEKSLALWVTEEVNAQITNHKITYIEYKNRVPIINLSELLNLIDTGKINNNIAKDVFSKMVKSGKKATEIILEEKLEQVSDKEELLLIIKKIIKKNPKEAVRYQAGEKKLIGFFMGQIMKETRGRANPKTIGNLLQEEFKK